MTLSNKTKQKKKKWRKKKGGLIDSVEYLKTDKIYFVYIYFRVFGFFIARFDILMNDIVDYLNTSSFLSCFLHEV